MYAPNLSSSFHPTGVLLENCATLFRYHSHGTEVIIVSVSLDSF